MIHTASRLGHVQEYYFSKKLREIAGMNKQGMNILNLGIGSPDGKPANAVMELLTAEAQKETTHGYQSYKGIPQLRGAFADWYSKYFNVVLNSETEVLPLIGSKEGIFHISMTYLEEGDEVLVPNPGYPIYASAARLTGATIRPYDLTEKTHWLPDLDELKNQNLSKVKLMWVNYPNMPSGKRASRELFRALVTLAKRNDLVICNDNPYGLLLQDEPLSLLEEGLNDNVIELNSLSKSHNMAGWRMGMAAASNKHIENILRFKSNVDSGMFLPIQLAAVEALKLSQEWYDRLNENYKERRKLAEEIMDLLKCQYDHDQVGMFVWARVPETIEEVGVWIEELLHQAKVFITPGFIFGSNGERYIRISLCSGREVFKEVISRIQNFKGS